MGSLRVLVFVRYDQGMRTRSNLSFRTCVYLLAVWVLPGLAVAADALPKRKPGLWRLTTISEVTGMTTNTVCIGPDDSIAAPGDGRSCQEPKVKRTGDQVIVNLTCRSQLGEERISTLFTGDFQRWYRGITKMTFDPASSSGPANIGVTVQAEFVSPNCQD